MKTFAKRITKKEIKATLRTLDTTKIFRIAKLAGVDVSNRLDLCQWIKLNAPSKKVREDAYHLSFNAGLSRKAFIANLEGKNPINKNSWHVLDAIDYAKYQKNRGFDNYSKVLIIGNTFIYWASPFFGHKDYNKSTAFQNTAENRLKAEKINKYLGYNG